MLRLLAAAAVLLAAADAEPKVGRVIQMATGNVTGAASHQIVGLKVYQLRGAPDDPTWNAQIVVLDPKGGPIWAGPKPANGEGPLVFQGGPGGIDTLEVAGPLERAGQGEVVVQESQSDVSVQRFRILRWTGRGLEVVRSAGLMETPARSGTFTWTATREPKNRWISRFVKIVKPGQCQVELSTERDAPIKAMVRASGAGFKLVN